MSTFFTRLGKNKIDAEINEFGELNSIDFSGKDLEVKYKRNKTWRQLERAQYKITGPVPLGTTYPTPYDRESLIKFEYKPNSWYSYPFASVIITIIAIVIDTFCYLSMFDYGRSTSRMDNFYILISTIGAAIAIDVLPMFLAHNIHRISSLGDSQKSKKIVLTVFSVISFLLFAVVVGIVFKLRLFGVDSTSENFWKFVLMSMIPISTSLLCFISGYLSFAPSRKKLSELRFIKLSFEEHINEMNAMLAEFEAQPDYYETLKDEDDALYNAAINFIDDVSNYYKSYARIYIIPFLRSPAATSDLTSKRLFNRRDKVEFPIKCDKFFKDLYDEKINEIKNKKKK